MSHEVLKGEWKQMKGKLREWWGDLTDDDVEKIDGNADKLAGTLQQRYGYAKDKALDEIGRRIDEFRKSSNDQMATDKAKP